MKVCFLFSNFHLVNLTAEPKIAFTLAEKALKKGHEVHIISNDAKNKLEKKGGIHFFLFKGLGDLKTYLINSIQIIRYLNRIQPGVIHVHGGIIIVYAWFINLFLKIPLVFTFCEGLDTFGCLQKKLLLFCLSRMEAVFVVSLYLKNQLVSNNVKEKNIRVVRLGLEDRFLKTTKARKPRTDIFFFGDSSYERGFDIVYALAKKLPALSFTILLRWEKNCVKELNELKQCSNVRIYHASYKKPLIDMIRESKIILLPFRWMGVRPPLSIVESMAMGKCVVTSIMEGNEETIQNNENGIISDFRNMDTVAKQVRSLVNNAQGLRKIGEKAKKIIRTMYSDKEYTKIIDYYALARS